MDEFEDNDGVASPPDGNIEPTDSYEIGYGKPPKAHQFTPGHSGNSRGRRKMVGDIGLLLRAGLDEQIRVTDGKRCRKVSKGEAVLRSLFNKALSGNWKAFMALVKIGVKTGSIKAIRDPELRGGVVQMPHEFFYKKFNSETERSAEIDKEVARRNSLLARGLPYYDT
jgi:hypothetical protein